MNVRTSTTRTPLTANQIKGFWAAWGGWALDGMDSFIYALVLTPALTELLPRSGIAATPGNVGYYGSVLFALFLIGWGLSMAWGPIADRFGRVGTAHAQTVVGARAVREAVHAAVRAAHVAQFDLPPRVDRRPLGGLGVRPRVRHANRRARGIRARRRGQARIVRDDGAVA